MGIPLCMYGRALTMSSQYNPFGHRWGITSHKPVLTERETQKRIQEWLKKIS